jgi:hypothetical protein
MKTEEFSKTLIQSKIFDTYVATGFFGIVIFFVLNASFYTPIEMLFATVFVTVIFKGIANMMLSMNISLINLKRIHEKINFNEGADNLESLVNDLAIQEAAIQSNKTINKK